MDKDKEIKTRRSPARRSERGSNSSTKQSTKDSRTQRIKRKASPDKRSPRKRIRVSGSEPQNPNKQDRGLRRGKRKVREDGEGPSKKKRRSDESSSVDACRESSRNPLDVCSTVRSGKRKTAAEADGPSRKKRRSPNLKETKEETKEDLSVDARRAEFKAKYEQQNQLGEGGCGSVFAGYRRADNLPVAIKYIPEDKVLCKHVDEDGKQLSVEVAVMLKLMAGTTGSVGTSAPVSLLDWYDLDQELILVLERPVPSEDLFTYIKVSGGALQEEEAKIIMKQLVEAAIDLQEKNVFHRDIKVENILIESGSDVPRVRLIDFGLSCFTKKGSFHHIFYGTAAHVPPEWFSQCTYGAGPTTVWQLGVVLFEMMHRNASFETTRFLRNKLKISKKLSKNCQDFLQMCLTRAPEQRPTLQQLQLHPWLR